MDCQLGCNPDYKLLVTDRGGGATVAEVEFEELKWGRVLDDVSTAQVTVPAGCCGELGGIRSWRHELHVIRDGDEQWCGPITIAPNCRSGVTLVAWDMFAWLGKRVIRSRRCYDPECGGSAATGPAIAEQLIRDGLDPDDPGLLEYLTVVPGGLLQERDYLANSAYVLNALRDLARGGLDFTAIGRRLLVMPEGATLAATPLLTCEHFLGDVCTTDDGANAATRAVVTGKAADNETVVTGSAGDIDPYYGLLEVLLNDDTVKTASAAQAQAAGLLASSDPSRLLIQPPQGNALDPSAPVCIDQLIPGVKVPVALDCTCREALQEMRLTKLDVTVTAAGEKVAPLLSPVAAA
jgi:hypothetical protein